MSSSLNQHPPQTFFSFQFFPGMGYSYCSNNLYSPPIHNFGNEVLQLRVYRDTYQIDKDRYIPLHINCRVLYLILQNFFNSMHTVYQPHLPLQFNIISLGLRKLLILSFFFFFFFFTELLVPTSLLLLLLIFTLCSIFLPSFLLHYALILIQNSNLSSGQQGNLFLFNLAASPAAFISAF